MFSVPSQHRRNICCACVLSVALLWPCLSAAQTATAHARWEFGGATGLAAVGGDAFPAAASGIELSTFGAYHIASGWGVRASAALSYLGDAFEDPTADANADAGLLERAGFDLLVLSVGPVMRLAPPASLVAAYVGGQFVYSYTLSGSRSSAVGGGLSGGMTFWLSDWFAVESEVSASALRRRNETAGAAAMGRLITATLGLVVAFD